MTSSARTSGGSESDVSRLSDVELLEALIQSATPSKNLVDLFRLPILSQEALIRMQGGMRCAACGEELPRSISFCERCRGNSP
jgi:hypothetical protein